MISNQIWTKVAEGKALFSPSRGSEKAFNGCLAISNAVPSAAEVQIWLLIIMRWQVYHLARLVGKVAWFQLTRLSCYVVYDKFKFVYVYYYK